MTDIQLTYDLYNKWQTHKNISVIGSGFADDHLLKDQTLIDHFISCTDEASFTAHLKKITGHFSVVIELDNIILAAVDRIRTFPILLQKEDSKIIITDSVTNITGWNEKESDHFTKVFCTLENDTLLINTQQLQGGEYVVIDKTNTEYAIKTWFHHSSKTVGMHSMRPESELKQKLSEVETHMVDRAIQYADNRTILIPLSGGYDSRYLLALLKKRNYPDIECFTYGRKDSYEVLIARNVSEKLNVKWHFIEYTDELLSNFFTEKWEEYSSLNHHFTSLPHEQDFFALLYLKEKELLPKNAVVMNGFCQDIHAGSFIEPVKNFDLQKFIHHKYHILPNLAGYENSWNGYQEWLVKNRLSKFIINSVRVYEYFGMDFYLPFWDAEWINFWYDLQITSRLNQEFYTGYLFNGIFKDQGVLFKKPGFATANKWYSLKKIAKSILPKMITDQIRQQNQTEISRDPNNTLYLYESIYEHLGTKPEMKGYSINNVHALWFLERIMNKTS